MKKNVFVLAAFAALLAAPAHALGRHNGLFSFGFAGLNKSGDYLGYALNIEAGYLLHSVRASQTIHAFDLRFGFEASFPSYSASAAGVSVTGSFKNIYGYFSMAYSLGRNINGHRLMFDIIGYGASFGQRTGSINVSVGAFSNSTAGDPELLLKMDYILPIGIQFMASNGILFGFRHKISIPLGAGQLVSATQGVVPALAFEYSLIFNFGFVYGKKES